MLLREKTLPPPIPSPVIDGYCNLARIPIPREAPQAPHPIAKFLEKNLQNLKPVHPREMIVLGIKLPIVCAEEADAEAPPLLRSGVESRESRVESGARRPSFV